MSAELLNTIITYWTFAVWGLGMLFLTLLALHGVQTLAWRLYKDVQGWPVIYKAMREYHANCEAAQKGNHD